MHSPTPEHLVPEERRVLTLTGPVPARSSLGPLTISQTQVKLFCVDALWQVLRDRDPKYLRSPQIPRLDPVLIACLADLGESDAFRVLHQVRNEVFDLCAEYEKLASLETLLDSMVTDISSRVDHILYEKTYKALEAGEVIEGVSLEPIRFVEDEEEAFGIEKPVATDISEAKVIPISRKVA